MKKKVLFVCIGNSCRSQMAEGFARRYGSDVMDVESAGLAPASIVQTMTKQVMFEKNINIEDQWPKDIRAVPMAGYDLVINMSGHNLPLAVPGEVRVWKVDDPIGLPEKVYLAVRDQIENLVQMLVLELRRATKTVTAPAPLSRVPSPKPLSKPTAQATAQAPAQAPAKAAGPMRFGRRGRVDS